MFDYKQVWKTLHTSKKVKRHHIVEYFILQAIEKYRDDPAFIRKATSFVNHKMAKAFTPITRKAKLDNGRQDFDQLVSALWMASIKSQYTKEYLPIFGAPVKDLLSKEEIEMYSEIHRNLTLERFREYYNREYVYIFVRQDISPEYQAVQAAHATLKAGWHFKNFNMEEGRMNNLYFTLVGVPDLSALQGLMAEHKIAIPFYEPDLNDQMTAVVLHPVLARKRGELLKHKLLVFNPLNS